jgi:hypothetical protein
MACTTAAMATIVSATIEALSPEGHGLAPGLKEAGVPDELRAVGLIGYPLPRRACGRTVHPHLRGVLESGVAARTFFVGEFRVPARQQSAQVLYYQGNDTLRPLSP